MDFVAGKFRSSWPEVPITPKACRHTAKRAAPSPNHNENCCQPAVVATRMTGAAPGSPEGHSAPARTPPEPRSVPPPAGENLRTDSTDDGSHGQLSIGLGLKTIHHQSRLLVQTPLFSGVTTVLTSLPVGREQHLPAPPRYRVARNMEIRCEYGSCRVPHRPQDRYSLPLSE